MMLLWSPLMTLMADAARVIELRLQMMAVGKSTPDEVLLMVSEKVDAMQEARAIIMRGGPLRLSSRTTERSSRQILSGCQIVDFALSTVSASTLDEATTAWEPPSPRASSRKL
jgi:hypothetical protein